MTDEIEQNDHLPLPERAVADQLITGRPVPAVGFRAGLRRQLVTDAPGYGCRPPRLRLIAAGWLIAGLAFLAAGALLAAGLL